MQGSIRRRAAAAVTGATLLVSVAFVAAPALSSAARGPIPTVARSVVTSIERQRDIALPIAASHVVLHWAGNPHAELSVAFATSAGAYGPPQPVELDEDGPGDSTPDHADQADHPNAANGANAVADDTFGQVVFADGARFVRVTSDRPIARLTVEALDTRGTALQVAADAAALLTSGVADAAVPEPAVISRAAWGANEAYRFDGGGHERWPRSFDPLQKLIVHHTAGANNDPNPAATIRAIYYDHAVLRGWGDIGYNFLIDAAGHVYQGRYSRAYAPGETVTGDDLSGLPVRGGHAKGYNDGTVGISLLGTYTSSLPPTAQRNALISMLAWEAERHGLDPTASSTYVNGANGNTKYLANISGHRDVNPTSCPGDAFYATFPTLRQQVKAKVASLTGAGVDSTPPTATLAPLLSPTGGSTITFGLPFSEPITGLTADAFGVTGTSAGWAVTNVVGTASAYRVTVHSDGPTDGTVVLTLGAGSVTDLAGHAGPPADVAATATFATDTTAPSTVIYATPHGSATNVTSIDVTVTFSEWVADLPLGAVQIAGTSNAATPWTIEQMLGSGATYGFTISSPNPANGTLTIGVPDGATTDAAGNPSTGAAISIAIDRLAPTTSSPIVSLRSDATFGSSFAGRLSWSGADAGGSGLASYDVERSVDGGSYVVTASGLASPALNVTLGSGHTYRYAVRARDAAGNIGAWRASATTSTLVRQDTSGYLHWSTGWHVTSSTSFSGGIARYATTAGARVSTTFTGRAVAFVTTAGPTRGQVKVYFDGVYQQTLDLQSASTTYRKVAWSRAWASEGSHTFTLVVVGTAGRPRVDLDAILILH
jgi:hypothetical protein